MPMWRQARAMTARNPGCWVAPRMAWAARRAAGCLVYGNGGQSSKKGKYGVLGGIIGAGIGGIVFNPIAMVTHGGAVSRAVGFALVGGATGVGLGLGASGLTDRWRYVRARPTVRSQLLLLRRRTDIRRWL